MKGHPWRFEAQGRLEREEESTVTSEPHEPTPNELSPDSRATAVSVSERTPPEKAVHENATVPPSRWADGVARWTGRVLFASAVWIAIALIIRPFARGFVETVTRWTDVLSLPHPTLFSLVLVIILTSAVMRRQRAALWFIMLVWLLPVALVSALALVAVSAFDVVESEITLAPVQFWSAGPVALVLLVVLFSARKAFTARLRRGAWWRAAAVLFGGIAVSVVLTLGILAVVPHSLTTFRDQLNWTLSGATGTSPHAAPFLAHGDGPHWALGLAGLISAIALLLAAITFLRGAPRSAKDDLASDLAVRRLLLTYPNDDSLAYFATRDDRDAVFSANGEAAISYRVVADVALAAGDPLGDPEHWDDAIATWLAIVRRYGWAPSATGVTERGARPMSALASIRSFWVMSRFSTLAPSPSRPPASRLCAMPSPVHTTLATRGVLGFVPWARNGVSLDVMRRSPEAVNGVTELMISTLATQGRAIGIEQISLNFAMLREVFEQGERVGATPGQRFQRRLLLAASRWWQMDSLYKSNLKYAPSWQSRYMCAEPGQMTHALVAYGQAEGFVPEGPAWIRRRTRAVELERAQARQATATAVMEQETLLRMPVVPERHLSDQQRYRVAKLDALREAGMNPYPVSVPRTHQISEVVEGIEGDISISGRVVRLRDLGGVTFAVLRENSQEVQVMVTSDRPQSHPEQFTHLVDLADTISVTGNVTRSRTGELTVHAASWVMASKALTPPPDKFKGLTDADTRLRLRHVDLALNEAPTKLLRDRSTAIWAMRNAFARHDFIEVETPILQPIHGGANARPFTTHINAYDMDVYLRIAPELFLKRLAVGGFQRIFEIGRNFRNEGVDYKHNPEFTSVEAYQAYADYNTMRELTVELIRAAAVAVHGRPIAIAPDGTEIDLMQEWPVVTCHEAVSRVVGEEITPDTPIERIRELCVKYDIPVGIDHSHGSLVNELYDELTEAPTTFPTFYTDFPKETSPLTREHRDDPRLAERWDLVAFGAELGTAYSELINPVDQRERFTQQSLLAALGDPEAMEIDEEFLSALEFGLPPTGGLGLGVDRVYMFLVGATIRETLTFPFMKPAN